jgi:SAM-dependent methyltransferase
MTTDQAWVSWGERDPYYAVITDPRFRQRALTDDARREFFSSGQAHARWVLATARQRVRSDFAPQTALDFGCGVGRVAIPLAAELRGVVGVDVSPAMLTEAAKNADLMGVGHNTRWLESDDRLSRVDGCFDLVHSCIVLQHIDVVRGRELFRGLVDRVAPGGVGAIQVTYAKARHAERYGQPPAEATARRVPFTRLFGGDPEMQMNAYPLGELVFLLQQSGITAFSAEFTDHGGEWGVFLFFGRPPRAVS